MLGAFLEVGHIDQRGGGTVNELVGVDRHRNRASRDQTIAGQVLAARQRRFGVGLYGG